MRSKAHDRPESGRCRVCGARELVPLSNLEDGFSLVRCRGCSLVATFPPVQEGEIGRYYPPSYYGEENRRFVAFLERLIPIFRGRRARAIQRFVPKGRILDVGCGRGILPALMRDRGWEAYGVEFSEIAAHHASKVMRLPVFVGDFVQSPYPADFFDVVVLWHALEHVSDPVAAIRKSHEILRPGGLLVIAVPNFESLQARMTGRHWFHLDVPRHYHHFGLSVLRRLLESNGFQVESVSHFSMEQNPYGWIQSLLNAMGFSKNLLYDALKNDKARTVANPLRKYPAQSALMMLALVGVIPLSFALFLLEVLVRRGATVEVYARCVK